MRWLPVLFLLAACSDQAPEKSPERLLYAGEGRDRLCIAGQRGGLIVYGEGDANCSARGRVERSAGRLVLVPDGDPDCRIAARIDGDRLSFEPGTAACAYYCGPTAKLAGKVLRASPDASPAMDFAGDSLC